MGDAISPGATIITCAWMESEFLNGITPDTRNRFQAKRFMDDILLLYKESHEWDAAKFIQDISTNCYAHPLELEPGKDGVFLETEYAIKDNNIAYWLKNDNINADQPVVWRYQHFDSYAPYAQKKAAVSAALTKIQHHASGEKEMIRSGIRKLREFQCAGYPYAVLKYNIDRMVAHHTQWARAWHTIRRQIRLDYGY